MKISHDKRGGGRIVIDAACGHWKVDSRTLLKVVSIEDGTLGKPLRAGPRLQITVLTFLTVPPPDQCRGGSHG